MAKLKRALKRAAGYAEGGTVDDPTAGMSPVDLMRLRAELPDRRTDSERATARQGNRAELLDMLLGGRTAAEMGRDIAGAESLPQAAAQTGIAGLEAGLTLAGVRGPGKGAGNRLNTFVGPESKTADHAAFARAEEMRTSGADRGAIWKDTGWGWDEGGRPYSEIDDSMSKIRERAPGVPPPETFGEFYDHPELFAARPDIGELKFSRNTAGGSGDFSTVDSEIRVGAADESRVRDIALHEAQHAADYKRGASYGANPLGPYRADAADAEQVIQSHPEIGPLYIRVKDASARVKELSALPKDKFGMTSEELSAANREWYDATAALMEAEKRTKMQSSPGMLAYHRNAGEVRARNVMERADMTPEQRLAQPPWTSQDVPDEQQMFGEVARRRRFAAGGRVGRALRRAAVTVGAVRGKTPGRADALEVDVPAGAYVIPADIVAAIGEGNTEAGMVALEKNLPRARVRRANGGAVPILISDGEYVVAPDAVAAAGGHDALDKFVLQVRDAYARHLQSLPGPNI